MILSKKFKQAFSKMILFNGALSFSPNTINNTYMSYALAKQWEEDNAPYESWMQLISRVREINNDIRAYARSAGKPESEVNDYYNLKVFSDWNVEGDGAVYTDFTAKAIFDPSQTTPITPLSEAEQFPVSSPMGFHKSVIADMDTDSQTKSKIFGLQLILDSKLSLVLEPTEFRNLTRKYTRDLFAEFPNAVNDGYKPSIFGVDWFMQGGMVLLSHKDTFNAKHEILNEFAQLAQAGKSNAKLLKQFILRMNQFNYNYQTKLSFISGYIEPSSHSEAIPTAHWRTVTLPYGSGSKMEPYESDRSSYPPIPKMMYMREVKNGDTVLGILLDLNNLLEVVTVNQQFAFKDYIILTIQPAVGENKNNTYRVDLTKDELEKQVGMHFIAGGFLSDIPYKVKVEYFQDLAKTLHLTPAEAKAHVRQNPHARSETTPTAVRYVEGTESEFTFEILERYKKTKQVMEGDSPRNVEHFYPSITYDFRCMRFGKNIPADIMKSLGSQITINVSTDYTLGNGMDLRGVFQYADGKSDAILKEALEKSPAFATKYRDMANINKQYYQQRYKTIQDIANTVKQQVESVDPNDPSKNTYFWKNSKGVHFAPQFNNPSLSTASELTKTITLDENGRGTFELFLNQNLTRHNNPRTLVTRKKRSNGQSNPILSSIAVESTITASFSKGGDSKPVTAQDTVSGTYYESNPDLGQQTPDWKNYVGPRLRLMGLLYPAMQKIVNLYSFNQVDMDSMKRAFDIEKEQNPRYMPSTREISPFEHRMIRRWLYEPFFDHVGHTNIVFDRIKIKSNTLEGKKTFKEKKSELRQKLKDAFAFELFTIPLYLTAMYTTDSKEYQKVFRDVVHDEMKHLFIASNLINAIREPGCTTSENGPPYLDQNYVPSFVSGTPSVPRYVYDTTKSSQAIKDLYSFNIYPLNDEVLLKMIAAEFPSETKNLVLSLEGVPYANQLKLDEVQRRVINAVNTEQEINKDFHTIGELYAEIVGMLWDLEGMQNQNDVLFSGDAAMQFTYPQLTNMVEIYSLRTALNQIRLIVDEGEGSRIFDVKNQLKKLSHFLKFIEVYTGCEVDQEKTDRLNGPLKSEQFTIYFKLKLVTRDEHSNNWTPPGQDEKIRSIVEQELPGRRAFGYSNYTNVAAVEAFPNVYKKILLELHYVFNSNLENFKKHISKVKGIDEKDLVAVENEFKAFKFKRMENAIAKMRQMSLHARYNIRPDPIPNYEVEAPMDSIESKENQGFSVRPDYNVIVEFPNDDQ